MALKLAIEIDDDQKARLEAIAEARHELVAQLATEAVALYLQDDAEFRAAVDVGLTAGRTGNVSDFKDFAADLRRRMAVRSTESER